MPLPIRRTGALPAILTGALMMGSLGCAGPGPKLFPAAPAQRQTLPDGSVERWYDTNRDGCPDYREQVSPDGLLVAIGYDRNQDGQVEENVVLEQVPENERRHLVVLLDSVPHEIVEALRREGCFQFFRGLSRVISPFPVMTDLSFAEFFHVSPSPGVESEYYDGRRLRDGYGVYIREENSAWTACTDYHMPQLNHGNAYLDIRPWFAHELRKIQKLFLESDRPLVIGYCVGTSGMGAVYGRQGHVDAMIMVDRFCRELICQTRGRVRFTLLSDHGHYLGCRESKRIPLRRKLAQCGYRVRERLRRPGDVVVPEFSMVSCASIYTHAPACVARDVVMIEGVDLAAYREGADLVVVRRDGLARLSRSAAGFRYQPERGDPLELQPILARLAQAGEVDADGYVSDHALFAATVDHTYPDVAARLWRAFHGLVEHVPDVLVSLADGYHVGSKLQTDLITLIGVHGSLRPMSTYGFAMTTEGELPGNVRMADLRASLREVGVPFPCTGQTGRSTSEPVALDRRFRAPLYLGADYRRAVVERDPPLEASDRWPQVTGTPGHKYEMDASQPGRL